jgi:hypothetical protein
MSPLVAFVIPVVAAVLLLGSLVACFFAGVSRVREARDIERGAEST